QQAEAKLVTESNKLKSSLEQERVALGDSLSASEKLQMQQRHLGEQLELSARSVHNLEQQLEHAKTAYGANSAEVNKLETKLNEARTAEMRLKNEVEQTSTSLREQANVAERTGNKLKEVGEKTKEIGKNLTSTVTPAIAGVMGVTGKWANDFDTSQKQIQASLGLTAKGAENVGKVAEDVFLHGWGENLREVDNAVMKVWQNMKDVPLEELQNVTEGVMALSKTFDVDLSETTRGASALMTQYGMDGAQSLDLITAGLQAGLDKSGEFTDNLAEYTPLFKQAGFTSNEMMNILKNGLDAGAYNLDYVNDLVKEFGITVQEDTKGVADAFGGLSKETQGLWEQFKAGKAPAADVFKAVIGELKGMDNQVKATQIGVGLFGTKFEDLGNQGVYSLIDINKEFENVGGAMANVTMLQEEAFGQKAQSLYRELQKALEPLGKIFLELAEQALPVIKDAIESLSDAFSKLSPETQKVIGVTLAVIAALGPLMLIIGPLISGIGGIIGVVTTVVGWIGSFASIIGTVVTAIAGFVGAPVAAVVAAIVGIIAVVTLVIAIFKNWGGITDWLSEKWDE
ncbi:phage tail tape measure protein, partial [Bacillus sp. OA1]|nr:phage tail tape measure protein [Bacillus sp. OA1]